MSLRNVVATSSAMLSLFVASVAHAAQPYQEYRKHIESAQTLTALTDDLMGDSVGLYNGATEFAVTDISLPGNNALPFELRRRFSIEIVPGGSPGSSTGDPNYRGVGNWDVEVPYIATNWGGGAWPNTRCSAATIPSVPAPLTATDVWQGTTVHLPGAGDRKLLIVANSGAPQPTDGNTRYWTTRERDMVRCVPMQSGLAGEGFLLQTVGGLTYRFDVATTRFAGSMQYKPGDSFPTTSISRTRYYLLASRVADRNGNWVDYAYNAAGHPTTITASDGRQIALTYSSGRLASAVTNGRMWSYAYGTGGADTGLLTSVTRPDGSQWQYAHAGTLFPDDGGIWDGNSNASCGIRPPQVAAGFTLTATHPSGAVGTFQFGNRRHPRSGLHTNQCSQISGGGQLRYKLQVPNYFDVMSLGSKTITGPGLQPRTWSYDYPGGIVSLWGTRGDGKPYPCTTCPTEKTVTVTEPDGTRKQHRYGYLYASNEGRLLGTSVLDAAGNVLRTESTEYVAESEASGQPFYGAYGFYGFGYGADDPSSVAVRPVKRQTVTQDGVTFTMQVNTGCAGAGQYCFDAYGRPLSVTRSSTLGYAKTEVTSYHDNTALWVLGQVATLTVNGILAAENGFDSLARLLWTKAFGKLQQTLTYYADGTVETVADGASNTITLSSWKRGIPRLIQHPATPDQPGGTSQSALVDDNGWITAVTDENGFSTGYGYDDLGRLASIVHPTGDSTVWNAVTMVFQQMVSGHYFPPGIVPGQWRQVTTQGAYLKVVYFDAMWRPVMELERDNNDIDGTTRTTRTAYDLGGRASFKSYPIAGVAESTVGVRTEYDALDRMRYVRQDWEGSGQLVTETRYLAGLQTEVTNPRSFKTTTGYYAYDTPAYDSPAWIVKDAGGGNDQTIQIQRDAFGKPTQLRQSGYTNGVLADISRFYAYDAHQRLCRTVEPETGATLQGYDAAGNMAYSAQGLPATTPCDAQGVDPAVSARKAVRTYDPRNRLRTLSFPDGVGNQAWAYTPDNLPASITAYNGAGNGSPVVTAYHYNKRRLLDGQGETITQPGWYTWGIGYGYDSNANLSIQRYPTGLEISYSPNALGQATQAIAPGANYATAATYHPNGALAQFTYGNGIVHTMTQNARQLPLQVRSGTVTGYEYAYDANGNPTHLHDLVQGANYSRLNQYDGLDRLTASGSASYGGDHWHRFAYDAVDNLTSWKLAGVKDYASYDYDASNRLTRVRNTAGATQVSLIYDAQGNLAWKDDQPYTFDYGNRLRVAAAASGVEAYRYDGHGRRVLNWRSADNTTTLSAYSQSGQLLYQENSQTARLSEYVHLAGSLIATRETVWAPGGATTVKYQHTDALGSPVAVSDQGGQVSAVDRTQWEPYGAAIGKPSYSGVGYTGHVMDGATGLTYMQQRYYDPNIGRFLSVDPVTASSSTGANFNRYWYASNNPYRFIDPDGRDAVYFQDARVLVIPVYFEGSDASRENIALITARMKAIQPDWGAMKVRLQVLNSPGGFGTNRMSLSPVDDFRNYPDSGEGANDFGGNRAHINSSRGGWVGAAVHDLLHLAGAREGYTEEGRRESRRSTPKSGYTSDHIMADRGGSRLAGQDIDNIVGNETTIKTNLSGFKGVFRVNGRIDSRRLDKELSK